MYQYMVIDQKKVMQQQQKQKYSAKKVMQYSNYAFMHSFCEKSNAIVKVIIENNIKKILHFLKPRSVNYLFIFHFKW